MSFVDIPFFSSKVEFTIYLHVQGVNTYT
jgi:hypothetical protein